MLTITYIELICKTYQDQPYMKIRYLHGEEVVTSNMYSPWEVNDILHRWQDTTLRGSFGIGSVLAKDFRFQLMED